MLLEGCINYFEAIQFLRRITNGGIEALRISKDNPQAKKLHS